MSTETGSSPRAQRCERCGALLSAYGPEGLCPACMLLGGLEFGAEGSAAGAGAKFPTLPSPLTGQPGNREPADGSRGSGDTLRCGVTEAPGEKIGRYKLLQRIGEGGCGLVYMAEQEEPVRRRVALKVIKLGMDTRQVIARFEAERQALALMDHPNIAKVLDAGATEAGRPYFVMELVRGIRITDYCDQNNLPTRERLELFIQTCRAIQHAHQKGIIHRDIKPSNILVTLHDGVPLPKVIDFGIAKATTDQRLTDKTLFTQFEQFIGTPAYMSPEQAEMGGLDIDTRTDIYSLGVLLYDLLTGKTPFDSKELLAAGLDEMRRTIREKEPVRPSTRLSTMLDGELTTTAKRRASEAPKLIHALRGDLDWIVMKALEKDRTRRYDTANGLAMDIQRHLNHEAVTARPPSPLYRFGKLVRRNRLAFAAAAAVAIALVFGIVVSTWQAIRAEKALSREAKQRHLAEKAREEAQADEQKAQIAQAGEARQRRLAEERAGVLRRHLYVVDMKAAFQAVQEKKTAQARALVAKYLHPETGEEDLRGFEWRYLWQASQSIGQKTLWSADQRLNCAVFSPDGKTVAIGGYNTNVTVIDVASRSVLANLRGFDGYIDMRAVTFSRDGRLLAAQGGHVIRVWSTTNWGELFHWTNGFPNGNGNNSVVISPDSTTLATRIESGVGFWNLRTGERLQERTLRGRLQGYGEWRLGIVMAYSPDGTLLALSEVNRLEVRDARSLNVITNFVHGSTDPLVGDSFRVTSVAFSANFMAAGYRDGTLMLWDVKTWRQVASLQPHSSFLEALDFSPGGEMLATGGAEDEAIALWNVASLVATGLVSKADVPTSSTLAGHNAGVRSVMFAPDGRTLVSSSADGAAMLSSLAAIPKQIVPIPSIRSDTVLWISADGKHLVTGQGENEPLLWDTSGAVEPRTLKVAAIAPCTKAISSDGKTLALGTTNCIIELWDLGTGRLIETFPRDESCASLIAFSPDASLLISAHKPGGIKIRSLSREKRNTMVLEQLASPFTVSPDGKMLAALSQDREWVELWDFAQNRSLGRLKIRTEVKHEDTQGAFSPDGRLLALCPADGRPLQIWDVLSKDLKQLLPDPGGPHFSSFMFAPDGRTLIASTLDGIVLFWNTANWEEMIRETTYAHSLAGSHAVLSSNGEWLAFGGHRLPDGHESIVLWHAPPLTEIDTIERSRAGTTSTVANEESK